MAVVTQASDVAKYRRAPQFEKRKGSSSQVVTKMNESNPSLSMLSLSLFGIEAYFLLLEYHTFLISELILQATMDERPTKRARLNGVATNAESKQEMADIFKENERLRGEVVYWKGLFFNCQKQLEPEASAKVLTVASSRFRPSATVFTN